MFSSKTAPRVLLVRPKYNTPFRWKLQLTTEPLGLEYLAAVAAAEGFEYLIHDPAITNKSFKRIFYDFNPDIVAITGYYPAKDYMIKYALRAKELSDQKALTVIGGVHAEINYVDFYNDAVDIVVHSGGTETFRKILDLTRQGIAPREISGTCWKSEEGKWKCGPRMIQDISSLPFPDRSHFYNYYEKFSYLHYGPVALVKTAYGCPFDCKFCYCRMLNEGKYTVRDIEQVVTEIKEIQCNRIWIIDDTFLVTIERIQTFVNLLQIQNVNKEFIIYSRSEFIAKNPEIVPILKQAGVVDVIVGFEAIDDQKLDDYNKKSIAAESKECIRLLQAEGIECTGLFIMDREAGFSEFHKLSKWIKQTGLTTYTLSIFSPYPGTEVFEKYREKLTTTDCQKWDLLHLVMKPTKMSPLSFYLMLFWMHLKVFFKNHKIRKYILSFQKRFSKVMT